MKINKHLPEMPVDDQLGDLAKQLTTYADAITAFSAAQNAAFAYAVMKSCEDNFAKALIQMPPWLSIGSLIFAAIMYIRATALYGRGQADRVAENQG